jgi:pimeloyl-ACP methyl ester carboxylesterase
MNVDGVNIFYREAGPRTAPAIVLLHGFPTSSQMFRNLIPRLADRFHLIAPDYPGFGQSDAPALTDFAYTFDHLAAVMDGFIARVGATRYSLYLADYGAPIGFRIAVAHPERVRAIVVQNGNAYDEGLDNPFWAPMKEFWADKSAANADRLRPAFELATTRWFYVDGAHDVTHISPDAWTLDQAYLDRPGIKEKQLELMYSYRTNHDRYPEWQAYFRQYKPPMLIAWGKNDTSFPVVAARSYLRDLPDAELHLFDTGHFALEEDGDAIAALIREFLSRKLKSN